MPHPRQAGWGVMTSHRSGETEDGPSTSPTSPSASNCSNCRSAARSRPARPVPLRSLLGPTFGWRRAKYNQLLRIEEELGRLRVFGVPPLHAQTRSRPRVPRAQGAERAAGTNPRATVRGNVNTSIVVVPTTRRAQGARRLSRRRRAPPRGGRGNRGEARVGRLLGRPAPPFPNRAPALREPLRNGRAEAVRAAAHAGRVGERIRAAGCAVAARAGNRAARTSASADALAAPAKSPAAFFQTKTRASPVVFFPPRTTTTTERSSPRCRRRDAACLPGRCGAFRLCRTGLGTRTNEKTSRTRRLFAARRA